MKPTHIIEETVHTMRSTTPTVELEIEELERMSNANRDVTMLQRSTHKSLHGTSWF
jgi:hypothetical protein